MVNFWNNGPGAGGLGTALGVDAIAEFQTLTHDYSAQYGGNGAVINASSKSGTTCKSPSRLSRVTDEFEPPLQRRSRVPGDLHVVQID